ncbi:MAG: glycosyltransferase family 1 protein [Anaerolineales bacterium]
MLIGIDATALPPQPGGAGSYIIHLIRALASLSSECQFTIFAHHSGRDLIDSPPSSRMNWVLVPDKNPARRLVWEQVTFPRLVRQSRVGLLHSLHYTRPLSLSCASVVTFHDMTFFLYPHLHTRSKRIFFPTAIRLSARLADALIAVSENTKKDAVRLLGVPGDKITAIPHGVGEEFHPITDAALLEGIRRKYKLPQDFILNVGIVEPRKNLALLLKSYQRLHSQGISLPLVIVGGLGWMYEDVFRQAESLGIKEQVYFTGYVPDHDLPIIYNLARIFVYPSIYEGFGLPPLEAMACGTPVITTAVSSMPEHVGDAGILIPPQDEKALTNALQKLINDSTLQEKLSSKGLERASQFTWKRTAQETIKVYNRVLTARQGA